MILAQEGEESSDESCEEEDSDCEGVSSEDGDLGDSGYGGETPPMDTRCVGVVSMARWWCIIHLVLPSNDIHCRVSCLTFDPLSSYSLSMEEMGADALLCLATSSRSSTPPHS